MKKSFFAGLLLFLLSGSVVVIYLMNQPQGETADYENEREKTEFCSRDRANKVGAGNIKGALGTRPFNSKICQ